MPRSTFLPLMRACMANIVFSIALVLAWQISQRELWLTSTLKPSVVDTETREAVAKTPVESSSVQSDNDDDDDDDASIPRNLSLVFVGDSLMRYQYLSLAYFLRHGHWFDCPPNAPANLVNAHSFHHPAHPQEDWNEFFLQSNRMLYPMEACDCVRSRNASKTVMERRYFYDEERNNKLVYINLNGNKTHGSWGFYGRFEPQSVFENFDKMVKQPVGFLPPAPSPPLGDEEHRRQHHQPHSFSWEYATWGEVLREHVGKLKLDPSSTTVILNAGLHRHNFGGNSTAAQGQREDIRNALQSLHFDAIWRTTTFTLSQLLQQQQQQQQQQDTTTLPRIRSTDRRMCELLGKCLNLSWTANLRTDLYFDELHVLEPVYRTWNEELLEQLGALPASYQSFDKARLIR